MAETTAKKPNEFVAISDRLLAERLERPGDCFVTWLRFIDPATGKESRDVVTVSAHKEFEWERVSVTWAGSGIPEPGPEQAEDFGKALIWAAEEARRIETLIKEGQ